MGFPCSPALSSFLTLFNLSEHTVCLPRIFCRHYPDTEREQNVLFWWFANAFSSEPQALRCFHRKYYILWRRKQESGIQAVLAISSGSDIMWVLKITFNFFLLIFMFLVLLCTISCWHLFYKNNIWLYNISPKLTLNLLCSIIGMHRMFGNRNCSAENRRKNYFGVHHLLIFIYFLKAYDNVIRVINIFPNS